ncbi:Secondary metabolism regulator LAE1 [Vanrija pseudolonga]|uniref:Secondary metabolism regulator LAE1 n=1 Tax=Vanrija pseudolonga TaxID=143232 RepID=A0AAF0Y6I6_9TREE|nr:Secondary metabolism regulator LAE1 [Vanrija pseudolonga]
MSRAYQFPVDQAEVVRLDRQHYLLGSLPDLYRGPVDAVLSSPGRVRRVLDVGCGTGMWLHEMAARFPHADCVGVDLLPLQHSSNRPNVTFMLLDAPAGLDVFPAESFDVVHIRQLIYAIPDYAAMLAHAHRVLRRGGIVLIHETNFECYSVWECHSPDGLLPGLTRWKAVFCDALSRKGIQLDVFDRMEALLATAGFTAPIDAYFHYRPVCPRERTDVAQHETESTRALVDAARLSVIDEGVLSSPAYDLLEAEVRRELAGQARGSAGGFSGAGVFVPWGFWWVRKAAEGEAEGEGQ